jgi:hypothetical protein
MGSGERQPGGWAYSIMPFLEEGAAHVVGQGLPQGQKSQQLMLQKTHPLEVFNCPSRRPAILSFGPEGSNNAANPPDNMVAKLDYAANGGSYSTAEGSPVAWFEGPPLSCIDTYPNCNFAGYTDSNIATYFDGVVVPRFPIELRQISDGTSKTMLVGEKYLALEYHDNSGDNVCVDNNLAFQGYDWDVVRWANRRPNYQPVHDAAVNENCTVRFGSSHTAGFHAAYADGSVHTIEYGIDPLAWEFLGDRNDGATATQ